MNQSPDFFAAAIKMIVVLGILVGVLILSLYAVRKLSGRRDAQARGQLIRVVATTYVGVKKCVSLVEVPGAVLILGITNDRINLLHKVENGNIVEEISAHESRPAQWSFSEHFQKISSRYKRERV
jgi:flagellar protein FliO/FliZ